MDEIAYSINRTARALGVGRSTIYGWFKARDERGVAALVEDRAKVEIQAFAVKPR